MNVYPQNRSGVNSTSGTVTRSGIRWGETPEDQNQANQGRGARQPDTQTDTESTNPIWDQYRQASAGALVANRSANQGAGSGRNNSFSQAAQARPQRSNSYSTENARIAAARQRSGDTIRRDTEIANAELDASWHSDQADLNVWETEQAITDANNRRGRDTAALTQGRRGVGGGRFSAAATGRGRTVLGASITGGLDAANRTAAKKTKSDAIGAKYNAKQAVISRTAAANEAAANAELETATQQNNSGRQSIRMA